MSIGENVKKLMDKQNVQQKDIAEAAGVSQAFISNMLKGYKIPSVQVLQRIAEYLGVTVDDLISKTA